MIMDIKINVHYQKQFSIRNLDKDTFKMEGQMV